VLIPSARGARGAAGGPEHAEVATVSGGSLAGGSLVGGTSE
jgi:hypothetical protein